MSLGGAMLALAAVQSVSQIGQGYAEKEEANYNATLLQGKAGLIGIQQDVQNVQYQKLAGRTLSTSMATVAKQGIMPSGSAMAVMVNTQKEIELDRIIENFNLEQQKQYTLAEADAVKRAGKQAVYTGYSNAFVTALKGVASYSMYKGGGTKLTQAGTVKDTTFDSVMSQPIKYNRLSI